MRVFQITIALDIYKEWEYMSKQSSITNASFIFKSVSKENAQFFWYTMLDIVHEISFKLQTGYDNINLKKRIHLHTAIWKINAKRITMWEMQHSPLRSIITWVNNLQQFRMQVWVMGVFGFLSLCTDAVHGYEYLIKTFISW